MIVQSRRSCRQSDQVHVYLLVCCLHSSFHTVTYFHFLSYSTFFPEHFPISMYIVQFLFFFFFLFAVSKCKDIGGRKCNNLTVDYHFNLPFYRRINVRINRRNFRLIIAENTSLEKTKKKKKRTERKYNQPLCTNRSRFIYNRVKFRSSRKTKSKKKKQVNLARPVFNHFSREQTACKRYYAGSGPGEMANRNFMRIRYSVETTNSQSHSR